MKHSLDINDWNKFIYNKKLKLINKIDKNDTLDKSSDSIKFNTILKDLAKSTIFNMSYTAFMTLKFLETTFIPSAIILNVMNIYSNSDMYKILIMNDNILANIKNNINYIKTIKFIIILIIDFVVTIELSLNIQCLLMTDFISKIDEEKYKNNIENDIENNIENGMSLNNNNFKPKIFKMFNTLNQNTITNIKPSTRILLIFKLLNKLGINNYIDVDDNENNNENNYDIINFIYNTNNSINFSNFSNSDNDNESSSNDNDSDDCNGDGDGDDDGDGGDDDCDGDDGDTKADDTDKDAAYNKYVKTPKYTYDSNGKIIKNENKSYINNKFKNYINNKKEINKKTRLYLDAFILDITRYFGLNKNNDKNKTTYQNIYLICSKYILNNTELVFNNYENLFTILEAQLLKNININEHQKLYYLRNVIKNVINIEIDNIKKLFCV
jgi:hypothetical protein